MAFKIGSKVQWKWLGKSIEGQVEKIFEESTVQAIKGKKIKRNGSPQNPAYLVKSEAGNLALKLESELSPIAKPTGGKKRSSWKTPSLFATEGKRHG